MDLGFTRCRLALCCSSLGPQPPGTILPIDALGIIGERTVQTTLPVNGNDFCRGLQDAACPVAFFIYEGQVISGLKNLAGLTNIVRAGHLPIAGKVGSRMAAICGAARCDG